MSLLYVFAASPMEAEPVRKAATAESHTNLFRCGVNEVLLLAGAMGPKGARDRAEGALVAPSNQRPDAVVIVGLCGGLTTDLPEERIVLYEACASTDAGSRRLSFSSVLTKSVGDLLTSSNIRHERVTAITSPRIAINRAEKTALSKSGAQVVDMESYSILDVAALAGVPVIGLRVVADSIDRDLPDFNKALNPSGALDNRRALGIALRSPVATVRLLAANKRAMQRLSGAVELVLKASCFS